MAALITGKKTVRPLGAKVRGSASKGLQLELSHETALEEIFGTDQPDQAMALLSHCIKVLKRDESSDEHPGNDERQFMVSIIRDLAPRDAVERMLAVQMAATHVATIRSARWMAIADNLHQIEAHRLQQAGQNVRGPGRGTEKTQDRRAAKGHRRARHGERGRTSHCW